MEILNDSHSEYILDVLEDEQNRLMKLILRVLPRKYKYHFNRLIEVMIEINKISN